MGKMRGTENHFLNAGIKGHIVVSITAYLFSLNEFS